MKRIYIFASLVAALTIVGCAKETPATYLDEIRVSSSYVTFNGTQAGSVTIDVDATTDWTFDVDVAVAHDSLDLIKGKIKYNVMTNQLDVNNWVTVTPAKGSAGKTKVTFAVKEDENAAAAKIQLKVKAGDKYQNIIVQRSVGASDIPVTPVSEVTKDGSTYRVKGTCTRITNTTYGNWYLKDDKGDEIYIYGTVDATGSYNWSGLNIAVGDNVTVEGPYVANYSELKDASVVKLVKALLLSDDTNKTISKDEKEFTVSVAMTSSAKDFSFKSETEWLQMSQGYTIDSKGNYVFTVVPQANESGAHRTGTLVFISSNGKKESDKDYNKTELNLSIKQLGTSAATEGGVKAIQELGKTSTSSKSPALFDQILENAVVTYKIGSYTFIEDETAGVTCYGVDGLSVGDTINGRVYGTAYSYNNVPQISSIGLEFAKIESGDAPKPTEVTLANIAADFDKYVYRYITVKDATVSTAVDVNYAKVVSAGAISDGTNTMALNHNSTGKYTNAEQGYSNLKLFYYIQAPVNSTVDVTGTLGVYKTNKQINIWSEKAVKVTKEAPALEPTAAE